LNIDDWISESYATVTTWDHRKIFRYEALGRATRPEYDQAVKVMDKFIGRKGVFLPKIIIVDDKGLHIETTNRTKLPMFEKSKKTSLLQYEIFENDMPLTNPAEIESILEKEFKHSKFAGGT